MRFLKKEYNRAQIIDLYLELIKNGEIEFFDVRKELEKIGIEEDEVNIVTRHIDDQIMRYDILKAEHEKGKNLFYGGLILTFFGLVFTITTMTGIIDMGNTGVISYGPFFGGLLIAMNGRSKMNRF